MCGGYLLHPKLPEHSNGRQWRRGAVRVTMVHRALRKIGRQRGHSLESPSRYQLFRPAKPNYLQKPKQFTPNNMNIKAIGQLRSNIPGVKKSPRLSGLGVFKGRHTRNWTRNRLTHQARLKATLFAPRRRDLKLSIISTFRLAVSRRSCVISVRTQLFR